MPVSDYGNLADPRYIHVQLPVQGQRESMNLQAPVMNLHYYQLIPSAAFPMMPQRVPTPEPPEWLYKQDETTLSEGIFEYNPYPVCDSTSMQHNPQIEHSFVDETTVQNKPHTEDSLFDGISLQDHAEQKAPSTRMGKLKKRRLAAREKAKRVQSQSASPSNTKRNRIPWVKRKKTIPRIESTKKKKSTKLGLKVEKARKEPKPSSLNSTDALKGHHKQFSGSSIERNKSPKTPEEDRRESYEHFEVKTTEESPVKRVQSVPTKQLRKEKSNQSGLVGMTTFSSSGETVFVTEDPTATKEELKEAQEEDINVKKKPKQRYFAFFVSGLS
jgi:hypothetical protein